MIVGDAGGRSTGTSLGSAVAKAVKKTPKSTGRAVGHAAAKAVKPRKKVVSSHSSRSSSRSSSSSSRSKSSGSSGGGVGRSVAAAVKKPVIPSLASYLSGDSTYQGAVRGQGRTLADYLSELTRRRGEAGTQFTQTQASMERDRTQQLDDLKNEFASRGLIQSGLYGQEQGKFQQQFTDQSNALNTQQTGLLADLMDQEKGYRRENDLALEAAKQQALQRRAAKYNIGA